MEEGLWPKITELARPYLSTRHNERHTEIALDFARTLLAAEPGQWEVVIPAVTLHDVGWSCVPEELQVKAFRPDGGDRAINRVHETAGVRLAAEILRASGYPERWRPEILAIIDHHDSLSTAVSLNDALVKDADKLWRFSAAGFAVDCARFGFDRDSYWQLLASRADGWMLTGTGRRLAGEHLAFLRARL